MGTITQAQPGLVGRTSAMTIRKNMNKGFTIVELLIVIVVIAILAAISVVAYNGIQQRARYSVMQQDIATINKALQLYYAENGHYPYSGTTSSNTTAGPTNTLNIPGLAPTYISSIPRIPDDGIGGYYAYCWSAYGTAYKIIRLVPTGPLPSVELANANLDYRQDSNGNRRGWGLWSSNGAGL